MFTCPICIDTIKERISCVIPCGHIFHNECIRTWISNNPICPLCRSRVDMVKQLYGFSTESKSSKEDQISESEVKTYEQLTEKVSMMSLVLNNTLIENDKIRKENIKLLRNVTSFQDRFEQAKNQFEEASHRCKMVSKQNQILEEEKQQLHRQLLFSNQLDKVKNMLQDSSNGIDQLLLQQNTPNAYMELVFGYVAIQNEFKKLNQKYKDVQKQNQENNHKIKKLNSKLNSVRTVFENVTKKAIEPQIVLNSRYSFDISENVDKSNISPFKSDSLNISTFNDLDESDKNYNKLYIKGAINPLSLPKSSYLSSPRNSKYFQKR